MLIRRILSGLLLVALSAVAKPAYAEVTTTPLPICKQNPNSFKCLTTVPGQTSTPGAPGDPGVQETGASHITCRPFRAPGVPLDVDCNGCQWTATDLADAMAGVYARLVPAGIEAQIAAGSTLYESKCWSRKYANSNLEAVYEITYVLLPPGEKPPTPGVPAVDLAWEASDGFDASAAQLHLAPKTESYVNLRTFLWMSGVQKHYEASATDGIKTVTVSADEDRVDWNMTEAVVPCADFGTPWDPSGDDEQTTTCGYTYKQTSAGQPGEQYPVRATIYYRLTWTCAGNGCDAPSGTLRPKWINKDTALRVAERQTVVTDSGGGTQ